MSRIVFIFSGQGAQTVGMGKDLYEASKAAKAVYDEADSVLGWSVSDVCFNGPAEKLTSSINCQPAIYTTSMACLAVFQEKFPGIEPVASAGLSLGEYAAFASAGYFSFADGLKLVSKRGEFMDAACRENPGVMACILGGNPEDIAEACAAADIDVANYNCPGQTVISGVREGVEKACALIKEKKVKRIVPLTVAGAFHSRLMKSAGEKFSSVLEATPVHPLRFPVAQNVIGKIVENESDIKPNLVRQVAGSVRWEDCVRDIAAKFDPEIFIEFGPGTVLTGLVRKIDPSRKLFNVSCLADLDKISFC